MAPPAAAHTQGFGHERRASRVRRWLSTPLGIVLLITLGWGANIGLRTWSGFPRPVIHDEFSYLLAADTFATGRLTNPAPDLPAFFETFHVITEPTRASKYPAGQGLLLALGQRLGGHPFFGVWLGGWLFCLATAWMVRAFAPPGWAATAALVALVHPQTVEWGLRYWGGLLGACGSALVIGAVARLHREIQGRHAIAFSLGATVLALTRPFEGMVLCVLAALSLLVYRRHPWHRLVFGALAPAALGLLPLVAFQLTLNTAVTGHPLVMPYAVYQRAHLQTPAFLWQDIDQGVVHRHEVMATFEKKWIKRYERQHSLAGFLDVKGQVIRRLAERLLAQGLLLVPATVTLGTLWWRRRRRRRSEPSQARSVAVPRAQGRPPGHKGVTLSLLLLCACIAVLLPETFGHIHYVPWGLPAAVLLVVSSSRTLGALVQRSSAARLAAGAVVVAAALFSLYMGPKRVPAALKARFTTEERLLRAGGTHLVFVRYGAGHSPYDEWVYNPADLDAAPVLFVRDLGEENLTLMARMPERTVWRAVVSPVEQKLEPWEQAARDQVAPTESPPTPAAEDDP